MKQAIITGFGNAEKISFQEVKTPQPQQNEVLVKVKAAGLNPKDILIRKGKFKLLTGIKTPQSIGFDFSGIIQDPNNKNYKKGERVFGMLNGMIGRSCAEYVNVSINELYKMPEEITFEEAAGIPLAGQTALQAIRDIGQIKKGESICINGASGGVGTIAIQIAKELGGNVTTISSSKNLSLCKSLGANNCISYDETIIINSKERFDIFFDVFGNYSFEKAKHLLSTGGIYITTVPSVEIIKEQIWNLFRTKKAKLIVVKSKMSDLRWLAEKLKSGKIKSIVDKIYSFDEIREAQKHIESKRARGKVILKME